MQAYYDNKPSKFEEISNIGVKYRHNIVEVEAPASEDEAPRTQWVCEEVDVYHQVTRSKIVAAVINDRWDNNYEQKLINEYNSAVMGVYSEEEKQAKITAYKDFLNERNALKAEVYADCEEAGIK